MPRALWSVGTGTTEEPRSQREKEKIVIHRQLFFVVLALLLGTNVWRRTTRRKISPCRISP